MTAMTDRVPAAPVPLDADAAVRIVLRETLDLLRAALDAVLGEDEAEAYGLTRQR